MISRIVEEINKKGQKVDGVIQHSYNPLVNDAVQFFVYSGNRISHIVSTYRNPVDSRKRLHDQNDLMGRILKRVQDTPLRENILFSTWLLDLPQGCFRIQEFKKKKFYFQISKHNLKNLQQYLDLSCAWVIDFQKVTRYATKPVHHLAIRKKVRGDISNLKAVYSHQSDVLSLLIPIESKLDVINTPVTLSMHHGDYCYGNCFTDTEGIFRVFDWEFAKTSEWVFVDYVTNLIVTWLALRSRNLIGGALKAFFEPQNGNEEILSKKLHDCNKLYGFAISEIKFYLAYVYLRLFFRRERTAVTYGRSCLPDMISILKSINVPRVNENS